MALAWEAKVGDIEKLHHDGVRIRGIAGLHAFWNSTEHLRFDRQHQRG
jgi:hypothetical protein